MTTDALNSPAEDVPDEKRRKALIAATTVVGGLGMVSAAVPFLASLAPSERARAFGGPVEADLAGLRPGELATVEWRGMPVWILRRTPEMTARLKRPNNQLRDPDSELRQQPDYAHNPLRSIKPDIWVGVGLCTHLQCIPTFTPEPGGALGPDWPGGFYCPCHGSKFDLAGRVYEGVPAPKNLQIPEHAYLGDTRLVIGSDKA